MSIIPALRGRLMQEDCHELYIRLCLKKLKGGRIVIPKGGLILLSIAVLIGQPSASNEKATFLIYFPLAAIKC